MKNTSQALCAITDLGLVDYQEAYQKQKQALAQTLDDQTNRLFLCEHPRVFTLGRLDENKNFLVSPKDIEKKGIDIISVDRGGEITFHGPGQLVAYPIFHLNLTNKDLKQFLCKLEDVIIDLLSYFGIVANRLSGHTGVWIQERKIASIGLGVKKWVSYHGLALNVNTELKYFSLIRPCGLDVAMTSLQKEKGHFFSMQEVKDKLISCFEEKFRLKIAIEAHGKD